MNNKVFDFIRFIGEIVLPALGALYFGIAKIWGFPYGQEIVGTLAVITTFIGAIVGVSRKKYNDQNEILAP